MEYRVKEYNNKFYVQCLEQRKSGILWWRKTNRIWHYTDEDGNIIDKNNNSIKIYTTQTEASNAIAIFKAGPHYYYY